MAPMTAEDFRGLIVRNLRTHSGRTPEFASKYDWYNAVALAVREQIYATENVAMARFKKKDTRLVAYLSAEFLLGPHLRNHIINMGLRAPVEEALKSLDQDFDDVMAQETEPGLGNGGLGRLAACFLDSLATLGVPAAGYGIRYEFGIFGQVLRDGAQVEVTDKWLKNGNPWEVQHPDVAFRVGFGGRTETVKENGGFKVRWHPDWVVRGVAYDTPISGYRAKHAALLRLWKAEAVESFDFAAFNSGDYYRAVEQKMASENISKVLYPNDSSSQGKRLRLEQQYFFVSCTLQDLIRINHLWGHPLKDFPKKFAVQLNDTHPAVAVPELMRLLMDVHGYGWDDAWDMTRRTFSYTNHTLLPEALERWPLALFGALLPRHLEIIYEINRRFLAEVRLARPDDEDLLRRVSLIDESGERYVRMAHVAVVGGHAVNGVAALHTRLLREDLLKDFDALAPGKIQNVTNGVTPRRWVVSSNPGLTKIISDAIGEKWIFRAEDELVQLEPFAADAAFRAAWNRVKAENKNRLAARLKSATGLVMDPAALLDVQVKRIHEYKRQHLSVLHIVRRFLDLKARPQSAPVPRTFLFGGKAAPGYFMAKLIIRFINAVGEVVNRDPAVSRIYRVAFFPDFNVKNGEFIYPAAELSEQISTAGKEASGTGNMKFTLNGALTVGTLDGANVEIREAVGEENFFLFGLTVGEVGAALRNGYRGRDVYDRDPRVKEVMDSISSGFFSRGDPGVFRPLVDSLMGADPYLTLADFSSYLAAQDRIDQTRRDPDDWSRRSILNVARAGRFSSDRSIREYAQNIWHVPLGEPDA